MYTFGSYAGSLRQALLINQKEVMLLGSLLDGGTWAGVLGGLVLDRLGPRTTAVAGAALMFVGYFVLYLAAAHVAVWTANFFPLWCFMAFVAGQGASFFVALGLKANLGNFSIAERGQVVGTLQSMFGLSAGVLALVQRTWYSDAVAGWLLFLGLFCSVIGGLIGLLVNSVTLHVWALDSLRRHYASRIRYTYAVIILTSAYVLVVAILKQTLHLEQTALVALTVVACCLAAMVLLVCVGTGPLVRRNTQPMRRTAAQEILGDDVQEASSSPRGINDDFDLAEEAAQSTPHVLTGASVKEVVTSLDFYVLFFIWMAGAGCVGTISFFCGHSLALRLALATLS